MYWVIGSLEAVVQLTDLGGGATTEELGVSEGVELGVPEGPVAGVSNTTSVGNVSISTFEDVYIEAAFLHSSSSFWYTVSIRRMSVEEVRVTFTSIFSSHRTRARLYNSVINTGRGRDVWYCLALMAISYLMIAPKLRPFPIIIDPRQASFVW
ncbi:hypothetical protein H5410_005412 [Solanum commersonii]|uniref:Uncharacterized protein n=1 Tax=Solanum commersonii TaxID=4109 RepID=A0A9J6A779_SOLCO|nr:hypothetical protein H5410_005412 [Solanum commersonii]